jgi:hypothetical protein
VAARLRAASVSYPILVPAAGLVVGGVVFQPKSTRDDVRIRHFEEGEYAEHWSIVRLAGGRRLAARVFLAFETLQATEEAWDLGAWASAHKAAFLAQCREWMRDCPGCEGKPVAFKRRTS